jgi:hypothetical protein
VLSCVAAEPQVAQRLGATSLPGLHECEVELVTGRTHQIRLQFSALSAPIFGDTRYTPVAGRLDQPEGEFGTLADGQSGADSQSEQRWGDGSALFGQEPRRIGLHCACLSFPRSALGLDDDELAAGSPAGPQSPGEAAEGDSPPGSRILLSAGAPWWRE